MGNILFKSSSTKNSNRTNLFGKKRKHNETNNDDTSDEESDGLTTLQSKKFKYSNLTQSSPQVSQKSLSFLYRLFKRNSSPSTMKSGGVFLKDDQIDSFLSCNTSMSGSSSSSHQTTPDSKIASFSSLYLNSNSPSSGAALNNQLTEQINLLNTPIKKKMTSTSDYVYKTLFLDGQQSDITVHALNRQWHLHKLYLCQSPYFASMFSQNGQTGHTWRESFESSIQISIPDANINERALEITFGSFYNENVQIVPVEVIAVLACASLLSLDGLISQCATIMRENINSDSVLAYYEAALIYGIKFVEEATLKWLCQNLMNNNSNTNNGDGIKLEQLNLTLFERILGSQDLLIIQVETDLYSLCKKWLFFQMNGLAVNSPTASSLTPKDFNDYFMAYLKNYNEYKTLLEIPCLEKYVNVFKKIRLRNMLNDLSSYELIKQDLIVPMEWMEKCFVENWLNIIFVDQNKFSHEFEIEKSAFEERCLRFGRVLSNETNITWRWVGFNYGIDLLLTHTLERTINIKRNVPERNNSFMNNSYKGLLSHKGTQRIYYLIKIIKLDKFGTEVWCKTTDLVCQDLIKNEDKIAVKIDANIEYPLILNFSVIAHP